jgi:GT2 family glycosyltransferase
VNGTSAHLFLGLPADEIGYGGFTHLIRNYAAVTGAVLATRMSIVREVGGFAVDMGVDYNDVDFCFRVRAAGYRIVYTPFAELRHFENSSLQLSGRPVAAHQARFLEYWGRQVQSDPYYNPGLPRDRLDCKVGPY